MLTPSAVANAKPKTAPYKLRDERGLYVIVRPNGAKWWRFDYRRPGTGKRNSLTLGLFPDVSLKRARERRAELRTLLADGVDPGERRKAEAAAGAETFEAIAREWHAKFAPTWAPSHAGKVLDRLQRDVFPWIGNKPIAALDAPAVLAVVRRIESRGHIETAHRALQNCGQTFRYAVATGRAAGDVTRDLRGALTPRRPKHFASITDPAEVGALLRAIHGFSGTPHVAAALKLAPLVFVRPGELRHAEWSEIHLEAAEWRIPARKMKTRAPHLVPLSRQAVEIFRDLRPLTGAGRFVFPGARDPRKPISDMTINAAFRRLAYPVGTFTAHGFRAMARTLLDEHLNFRPDFIEHQLAHAVRDTNGRAYNRTSFFAERRAMMQTWADYLDSLREGGNVVALRRAGHADR
ncbi:MAG: integrase arm-type DNA-binding domain-containing protein [Gammaproteobacteria bacterium]|nr:integrase arm-type DNA-binding domain-containing protein [Gammaproteobacteria bacterium]